MSKHKRQKSYRFTIPVEPRTKQAVRFGRKGAFQPKSVTDYEAAVKAACAEYMEKIGLSHQLTMPLQVHVRLRKDRTIVTLTPVVDPDEYKTEVRGDVDNYAKALLDGLQGEGGIIGNDRQVWSLNISKHTKRK